MPLDFGLPPFARGDNCFIAARWTDALRLLKQRTERPSPSAWALFFCRPFLVCPGRAFSFGGTLDEFFNCYVCGGVRSNADASEGTGYRGRWPGRTKSRPRSLFF